jgi:hypothetical protein
MAVKYILAALAAVFLSAAAYRLFIEHGHITPASRTWLLVGVMFSVISVWLWLR